MAFSEKIYALRKRSGLSQEQLAEELKVSRQAISKWESGQSVPESDKLVAVSRYFNVSLDFLMKDEEERDPGPENNGEGAPQSPQRAKWLAGVVLCIGGIVCLIIWGILSVTSPAVSDGISESSTIRIDGNGIFLLLCVAAMVTGAVLLLRDVRKK